MTTKKLFLFCTIFIFSSFVKAETGIYRPGSWWLSLTEKYESTRSNFDSNKSNFKLANNGSLWLLNSQLKVKSDIASQLSVFGSFDFATGSSDNGVEKRSTTVPTELNIGMNALLLSTAPIETIRSSGQLDLYVIPEASFTTPLKRISPNTDEVILSEGTQNFRFGTYARVINPYFPINLGGFYVLRDDGRSNLFELDTYLGGIGWWNSYSTDIRLGLRDSSSVSDDKKVNSPTDRRSVTDRVNAQSFRFYSINSSQTNMYVMGAFDLDDNWNLALEYSQTLAGVRAASVQTFLVKITSALYRPINKQSARAWKDSSKKDTPKGFVPETYEDEKVFDDAVQVIDKDEELIKSNASSKEEVNSENLGIKMKKQKNKIKRKKRSQGN